MQRSTERILTTFAGSLIRPSTSLPFQGAAPPAPFSRPPSGPGSSYRISENKKGPVVPGPVLALTFKNGPQLPSEKPLPVDAVLESGNAHQRENAEVANQRFSIDRGPERKHEGGSSDGAQGGRNDRQVCLHSCKPVLTDAQSIPAGIQ